MPFLKGFLDLNNSLLKPFLTSECLFKTLRFVHLTIDLPKKYWPTDCLSTKAFLVSWPSTTVVPKAVGQGRANMRAGLDTLSWDPANFQELELPKFNIFCLKVCIGRSKTFFAFRTPDPQIVLHGPYHRSLDQCWLEPLPTVSYFEPPLVQSLMNIAQLETQHSCHMTFGDLVIWHFSNMVIWLMIYTLIFWFSECSVEILLILTFHCGHSVTGHENLMLDPDL